MQRRFQEKCFLWRVALPLQRTSFIERFCRHFGNGDTI